MAHNVQVFDMVVKRIVTHTPTVKSFYLYFPEGQTMPFLAGQFVMSIVPRDGKIVKKPYSIASSPYELAEGYIELGIKRVEGGFMSTYFHNLKEGDTLKIDGPYGKFTMKHLDTPDEIIFVATGTGITPLRSMCKQMLKVDGVKKPIHMILGCRYENELLYEHEMRELERQYPNFHFIPTVSRPTPAWQGDTKYVQDVLVRRFPNPSHKQIYACGLVDMIQGLKNTCLAHGWAKEQLHYEIWT